MEPEKEEVEEVEAVVVQAEAAPKKRSAKKKSAAVDLRSKAKALDDQAAAELGGKIRIASRQIIEDRALCQEIALYLEGLK